MNAGRALRLAVVAAAGLGGVGSLYATGGLEVLTQGGTLIANRVWNDATIPVVWQFHDPSTVPGCYSSTNAPPATLQPAVQIGFDAWQGDLDSRIAYSFAGLTPVRNQGADGVNVVTFCDSGVLAADPGYLAAAAVLALTTPRTVTAGGGCPPGQGLVVTGVCFPVGTYAAGTIIDADILYNSFGSFEEGFATNGAIGGLEPITQVHDVADVAAHEVGHVAGLSHDPFPEASMNPGPHPNPPTDGLGKKVLKRTDLSTIGRYYPESSFGTEFGSITGSITLNTFDADGVHVVAIDPVTMLGVAGRFSLSSAEDPLSLGPEGPDFAAQGAGFYRIDGLPPGAYYVYVEYFDNSEMFGRLSQRYNQTVNRSNVAPGTGLAGGYGFLPALTEFYDAGESGNGGDGSSPGTAADNADAATLVTVTAGSITPNVDIAINIEPFNGQTPAQRQNPTTRSVIANDALSAGDILWGFFLDGGGDDSYAVRFPAALLPPPPYNVAEGVWIHVGLSTMPMVSRLAFGQPGSPALPDLDHPVVPSAGRALTGGSGGALPANFLNDVRDQWNVTVNEARDIFVIVHQPDAPGGLTFPEAFIALLTCSNATCTSAARIGRSLVTEDGGSTWSAITNADLLYDLVIENDPPVMITAAVPDQMNAGETGDVLIGGFGFQAGAAVDFGPQITVNAVEWLSAQQLRANVTIPLTGATAPKPVDVKVTNPGVVFPNVARVFTVQPLLDDDGDGTPNLTDCAPIDGTLEGPADEVHDVTLQAVAGSVELAWVSQDGSAGSATTYDVVSGDLGTLRVDGDYAMAACAVDDHPDTPFVDATGVGPGASRYWLVSACNACSVAPCTYGDASMVPDPRDALDTSPPCP